MFWEMSPSARCTIWVHTGQTVGLLIQMDHIVILTGTPILREILLKNGSGQMKAITLVNRNSSKKDTITIILITTAAITAKRQFEKG